MSESQIISISTGFNNRKNIKKKVLKRKPLSTLVPSAVDQTLLIGSNGVVKLSKNEGGKKRLKLSVRNDSEVNRKTNVYQDSDSSNDTESQKKFYDASCQCEITEAVKYDSSKDTKPTNDEVIQWMTSSVQPEGYWKEIAEERRIALEETLQENLDLSNKVEELEKENEKIEILEKENEILRKLADEAQYIKNLLEDLKNEDD